MRGSPDPSGGAAGLKPCGSGERCGCGRRLHGGVAIRAARRRQCHGGDRPCDQRAQVLAKLEALVAGNGDGENEEGGQQKRENLAVLCGDRQCTDAGARRLLKPRDDVARGRDAAADPGGNGVWTAGNHAACMACGRMVRPCHAGGARAGVSGLRMLVAAGLLPGPVVRGLPHVGADFPVHFPRPVPACCACQPGYGATTRIAAATLQWCRIGCGGIVDRSTCRQRCIAHASQSYEVQPPGRGWRTSTQPETYDLNG